MQPTLKNQQIASPVDISTAFGLHWLFNDYYFLVQLFHHTNLHGVTIPNIPHFIYQLATPFLLPSSGLQQIASPVDTSTAFGLHWLLSDYYFLVQLLASSLRNQQIASPVDISTAFGLHWLFNDYYILVQLLTASMKMAVSHYHHTNLHGVTIPNTPHFIYQLATRFFGCLLQGSSK